MRRHSRAISWVLGALILAFLAEPAVAQLQLPKCRFYIDYENKQRWFHGAPCCAECKGSIHTAPFGNLGVDSNVGVRVDGNQFRGWVHSGSNAHWNACRNDFPPPDYHYYNATNHTQQYSSDARAYALIVLDAATNEAVGCSMYDGITFTTSNNYLELYELDPWPGSASWVGKLTFPEFSVVRHCSYWSCGTDSTNWKSPSNTWGYMDRPDAKARMVVDGEYIPGTTVVRSAGLTSVPTPSWRHGWWTGEGLTRSTSLIVAEAVLTHLRPSPAAPPVRGVQSPPLTYLTVALRDESGAPVDKGVLLLLDRTADGLTLRSMQTMADGRVEFAARGIGTRELVAFAPGFGRARTIVTLSGQGTDLDVTLFRGAIVTGKVIDPDGFPIERAAIQIEYLPQPTVAADVPDRIVRAQWHRGTLTSRTGTGTFEILDVDPFAPFTIRFSHPDHQPVVVGPLVLGPSDSLSDLEVMLDWSNN